MKMKTEKQFTVKEIIFSEEFGKYWERHLKIGKLAGELMLNELADGTICTKEIRDTYKLRAEKIIDGGN